MNQTNDKSLNAYQKPVTLKNVILFTLPTIAMSLFMSFYTMVDGLFVSRLIGMNALSAINLTAPVISLVTAVSTMLATGGSAVIMKKMGEKKRNRSQTGFYQSYICKCPGRTYYGYDWILCHEHDLFQYEALSGSHGLLPGLSWTLPDFYRPDPFNE